MVFSVICPVYRYVENTTVWREREYCEMQFRKEIIFTRLGNFTIASYLGTYGIEKVIKMNNFYFHPVYIS
jgi:hypothetical protein